MSKARPKRPLGKIAHGRFEGLRMIELSLKELMEFRRFVHSGGAPKLWKLLVRTEMAYRFNYPTHSEEIQGCSTIEETIRVSRQLDEEFNSWVEVCNSGD